MLFVKLFVVSYGIAKEAFNFEIIQNCAAKSTLLKLIIKYLTVLLTLVLLFSYTLVVPFIIIRCFVHLYLIIKHGRNFGSFISGIGTYLECLVEKSTIVTVITIEEINFNDFFDKLKIPMKKIHQCNYKFSSIIENCFGYKYYLKNQVKPEEVLRRVSLNSNETITRDEVLTFFENYRIFGKEKLWEVIAFEQPLIDHNESKKLMFAIRINHCVTDAYFMIALFKKYLLDPQIVETKEFNLDKLKRNISLDDVYINTNPINPKLDELLFHSSHDQFMATFMEDKVEYVEKMKKIKNLHGVTFNDVLLAGLVNSVSDFMLRKIGRCGNNILMHMSVRARFDDVVNILTGKFDTNELSNEFAILPFTVQTPKKNMTALDLLKSFNTASNNAKSSIDILLIYLMTKMSSFFPTFINKFGCNLLAKTACLLSTNMSAVGDGTIADRKIENVFAYSALHMNHGLMLNTVTFNDQLQLCLVGRVKFLNSREDLQTIVNGIIEYIDILDQGIKVN